MKIYLAAKFEDVKSYKEVKNLLEDEGHIVSCDWTKHKKIQSYSDNSELCRKQAQEDVLGIKDAEVVVALYNGTKGTGMAFEIGYAHALNKKVIIVGPHCDNYSMFVHLDDFILCKSVDALMSSLQTMQILMADRYSHNISSTSSKVSKYRLPFTRELDEVFINGDKEKIFKRFDYWSASTYGHERFAEFFDTHYGTSKLIDKEEEYYVIGVRNSNEGLEWSKTSPSPMTWDEAKLWVENLNTCKKEI